MKSDLPQYYVNSNIKITNPFYVVKCLNCGKEYWVVVPIRKCEFCHSDNIQQQPANKDKASH